MYNRGDGSVKFNNAIAENRLSCDGFPGNRIKREDSFCENYL